MPLFPKSSFLKSMLPFRFADTPLVDSINCRCVTVPMPRTRWWQRIWWWAGKRWPRLMAALETAWRRGWGVEQDDPEGDAQIHYGDWGALLRTKYVSGVDESPRGHDHPVLSLYGVMQAHLDGMAFKKGLLLSVGVVDLINQASVTAAMQAARIAKYQALSALHTGGQGNVDATTACPKCGGLAGVDITPEQGVAAIMCAECGWGRTVQIDQELDDG